MNFLISAISRFLTIIFYHAMTSLVLALAQGFKVGADPRMILSPYFKLYSTAKYQLIQRDGFDQEDQNLMRDLYLEASTSEIVSASEMYFRLCDIFGLTPTDYPLEYLVESHEDPEWKPRNAL